MVGIPAHSAMILGATGRLKMIPPADAAEIQIVAGISSRPERPLCAGP